MKKRLLSTLVLGGLLLSACGPIASTATGIVETVNNSASTASDAAGQEADEAQEVHKNESNPSLSYPIVDTQQGVCYDSQGAVSDCPAEGENLFGQDAQYSGNAPSYTDNGDGTVTANVTSLMWSQSPDLDGDGDIDAADKLTYEQALAGASDFDLAGYEDWRLPSIKELYSLILFDGTDPSGYSGSDTSGIVPFIDDEVFEFGFGDTSAGERIIDAQFASSNKYVSTTNSLETMFGVNFADGRIKGYGLSMGPREKTFYVLYVRGNEAYGQNDFIDNGDGTISDLASGLMWQQADSGAGMDWSEALDYCSSLDTGGYDDWRLPNAKELQSIVDYSRSPDTTDSAAIDPLFNSMPITNEVGQQDYAAYWSSTTHANFMNGKNAAYVSFGRAMGYMNSNWIDVHGAGAQRSDPKSGDASQYPEGHGPQGDAIRIDNMVRCVRGGIVELDVDGDAGNTRSADAMQIDIGSSAQDLRQPGMSQQSSQGQPAQNGQPPQEAIDACVGSSEGARCQVDTPNGLLDGICRTVQTGEFACVPEGGPPSQ